MNALEQVFLHVLATTLGMTLVGMALLAASGWLRRSVAAKWRYMLWLLLFVGLLIPLRPPMGGGVIRIALPEPVAKASVAIASNMAATEATTMTHGPATTPVDTPGTATREGITSAVQTTEAERVLSVVSTIDIALARMLLPGVWLAGAVLFLGAHLWRHHRFARTVARWRRVITTENCAGIRDDDGAGTGAITAGVTSGEVNSVGVNSGGVSDHDLLRILAEVREEFGVAGNPRVAICPGVRSPMLIGLREPMIILPEGVFAADDMRLILAHELVHLKRGDLWWKALILLASALHWFNPFVHWMARAAAMECEISCDETLLQGLNVQERRRYGEAIIGALRRSALPQTALASNFYGGKEQMKTRMASIMDTSRKRSGAILLLIAALATLSTGSLFAAERAVPAQTPGADDPQPPTVIHILNGEAQFTISNMPVEGMVVTGANAESVMMLPPTTVPPAVVPPSTVPSAVVPPTVVSPTAVPPASELEPAEVAPGAMATPLPTAVPPAAGAVSVRAQDSAGEGSGIFPDLPPTVVPPMVLSTTQVDQQGAGGHSVVIVGGAQVLPAGVITGSAVAVQAIPAHLLPAYAVPGQVVAVPAVPAQAAAGYPVTAIASAGELLTHTVSASGVYTLRPAQIVGVPGVAVEGTSILVRPVEATPTSTPFAAAGEQSTSSAGEANAATPTATPIPAVGAVAVQTAPLAGALPGAMTFVRAASPAEYAEAGIEFADGVFTLDGERVRVIVDEGAQTRAIWIDASEAAADGLGVQIVRDASGAVTGATPLSAESMAEIIAKYLPAASPAR